MLSQDNVPISENKKREEIISPLLKLNDSEIYEAG